MKTKVCTTCRTLKDIDQFTFRMKKGYGGKCKECYNRYHKQYIQERSDYLYFEVGGIRRSGRKLWELYRLTPQQYIDMYELQSGVCAICEAAPASVVDHNHTTGEVRALLCPLCNAMIGAAKENVHTLFQAVDYIEKHNKDVR